jgi:hypothetical protein
MAKTYVKECRARGAGKKHAFCPGEIRSQAKPSNQAINVVASKPDENR